MRLDYVYKITDMRTDVDLLDQVGILRNRSGGLEVQDISGSQIFLEWDDDDPNSFVDEEEKGMVFVNSNRGSMLFERLTLDQWKTMPQFWPNYKPNAFNTEKELWEYLRSGML